MYYFELLQINKENSYLFLSFDTETFDFTVVLINVKENKRIDSYQSMKQNEMLL